MSLEERAKDLAEQGDKLVSEFSVEMANFSKTLESNTLTNKWAADVITLAEDVENEELKGILISNAKQVTGNDVSNVYKITGTLSSIANH